ncbi:hypothetical protein BC628DRAFT_1063783 [Trametes gibbosa]|nr:hypothetical protein BC628DRAFT_1063783 [Trametes gibbosa]
MTRYHVFTGAPAARNVSGTPTQFEWRTITFRPLKPPPLTLPPATLAAASRRISMMYENVIFVEHHDGDDDMGALPADTSHGDEDVEANGQTTVITWPLTTQATEDHSRTRGDITFLDASASRASFCSQMETKETQETNSYDFSDASSIAQLPAFHFSLHNLTPLGTLINQAHAARTSTRRVPLQKASHKVSLLAAVLEVDGPDTIRIKKGPDAGKEISLLKLILGDESGGICKLAAWRETAEDWAGLNPDAPAPGIKKGDIVLLENVLVSWEPEAAGTAAASIPISLSASPQLKPKLEICYRTLPSALHDARFRPDLRLGLSDAAVRKVASVVAWFEGVAGLST